MFLKRLLRKPKNKKQIEQEIAGFEKRFGKTKEIEKVKKDFELSELKDQFFHILFQINFTKDKKKKTKLIKQAKSLAKKIPELEDWPKDPKKFWDIESFRWFAAIPRAIRSEIKTELSQRIKKGLNLSLGSGSYPYIENSILLDFSKQMLDAVPNTIKVKKKIQHDINNPLPFKANHFNSITAVFIVNYLKDLKTSLKEIKRVLKPNGKLIIVNSKKPIDDLYREQEVKFQKPAELKKLLTDLKFKVEVNIIKINKTELVLIEAVKQ